MIIKPQSAPSLKEEEPTEDTDIDSNGFSCHYRLDRLKNT